MNLYRVDLRKLDEETADVLVTLGSRIRVLGFEEVSYMKHADWCRVYEA